MELAGWIIAAVVLLFFIVFFFIFVGLLFWAIKFGTAFIQAEQERSAKSKVVMFAEEWLTNKFGKEDDG